MTEPSPSYRVLVGITGCIAAYKACEVVRGLQRAGCQVKVVMTEHATRFVDPVTFRALTHEKVAVGLFDDPSDPIHHISLAEWCDLFLIVPCTANVVAKLACGLADDLLSTTALACPAPLMVAPAMNMNMYAAPAFQDNLATLRRRGVLVVDADEGYQACGDVGRGRLPEPDAIAARALEALADPPAADATRVLAPQDLAGLSVVITAGPTVEPIDAVRFVSNHSSGKMGYALAAGAAARGARVTLISGPVALDAPEGVQVVPVRTAREMLEAAEEACLGANIAVFAAAVADYRPAHPADRKLKKGADDAALDHIELVRNPDILATIAAAKRPGQVVVGFAAETDDVVENARKKLASKHADLIVANRVGDGVAFGQDDDQATLVTAAGDEELPLMPKAELADVILTRAKELGR